MRKAYSLIEAMVAVVILSIIISVATNIIFISNDTENINKSMLVAEGLAQEGIEAIQNIYDTNILKYGEDKKEQCAFVEPGQSGENYETECTDEYTLYGLQDDEYYYYINRIYTSSTTSEMLTWDTSSPHATDSIAKTPVGSPTLDAEDENYQLYTHELCDEDGASCSLVYVSKENAVPEDGDSPSKYYREVMLVNRGINIEANSYVYWLDPSGRILKVKKQIILTK